MLISHSPGKKKSRSLRTLDVDRPLQPIYCGIELQPTGKCPAFCIYIHDGFYGVDYFTAQVCPTTPVPFVDESFLNNQLLLEMEDQIIEWLKTYASTNNYKIEAAGIGVEEGDLIQGDYSGKVYLRKSRNIGRLTLPSRLWFELDCLPFIVHTRGHTIDERSCSAVRKAIMCLHPHPIANLPRINVGFRHQVEVDTDYRIHMIDLEQYEKTVSSETWSVLMKLARESRQKSVKFAFFSSTNQGGGVSLMRHSLLRILHLIGVSAEWYVMKPKPGVFDVTKRKFHNVLQGVEPPGTILTGSDIESYERWCDDNVSRYWYGTVFPELDVAIIDDPQPAGIIPYIKKANPYCKIVYRSHIEYLLRTPGTVQEKVWNYLYNSFIRYADILIVHPVNKFIPLNVDRGRLLMAPATTDPLDGLNKELSMTNIENYLKIFNRISFDQTGKRLDFLNRPYIAQICRFDPSKGIADVCGAYQLFRLQVDSILPLSEIPQLVITGHGSIDDPDGQVVFEEIMDLLDTPAFHRISHDIIITRIPPSDQILNALFRKCKIALQLSLREGFEVKVTEAIIKNIPIIAYSSGGIPLQIKPGMTGFLVETGNIDKVAALLLKLCTDNAIYGRIKMRSTAYQSGEEYFTVFNTVNWLTVVSELTNGTLYDSMKEVLFKEKKRRKMIDCTEPGDICTIENAMNGMEIAELGDNSMNGTDN